jgi:hypothetical protein
VVHRTKAVARESKRLAAINEVDDAADVRHEVKVQFSCHDDMGVEEVENALMDVPAIQHGIRIPAQEAGSSWRDTF